MEPLSEARYRVQFTADAALKAKLDQARDLMRHRNPSGDLVPIVERAVELLLEQLLKERFGATQSPRQRKVTSERVTNAMRRAVIQRDGVQCTWHDEHGHRCPARAWLELDHRDPRGKGGSSKAENVRVLCRNHNRLEAERAYGRDAVERAIVSRRAASAMSVESLSDAWHSCCGLCALGAPNVHARAAPCDIRSDEQDRRREPPVPIQPETVTLLN